MTDGAFLGLMAGLGLLAIWWSMWEQEESQSRPGPVSYTHLTLPTKA